MLAVPFSLATLFFYPQLTKVVCVITDAVISPFFPPDTVKLVRVDYIKSIGDISFLDLPGVFPSYAFSLLNAVGCLAFLLLLPRIERIKPVMIFLMVIFSIHLISAVFFIFAPAAFPYDAVDGSRLYMLQQISIWFFAPLIMGLAVMPLPAQPSAKAFTMLLTYLYSLVFGTVRYAVFLFIMAKLSMLYMAVIFFALGPLADFIYIVGIYGVYVTQLTNKLKGDLNIWKWQFSS